MKGVHLPKQKETKSYYSLHKFKTLFGIGQIITWFGWCVVLLGFFFLVDPVGLLAQFLIYRILPYTISLSPEQMTIISSGTAFGCGVVLIFLGQLMVCLVAIERNTRITHEILKDKIEG